MVSGDEEVKLLLEAFQMSVSACLSHPQMPVLRAQMLGRLMAIQLSPNVKVRCLSSCAFRWHLPWLKCSVIPGHSPEDKASQCVIQMLGAMACFP